MNLFQARKDREVEVLVTARNSGSREAEWMPGVVVNRNFYKGDVRVRVEPEGGKAFRVTVPCADDYELPRVREVSGK